LIKRESWRRQNCGSTANPPGSNAVSSYNSFHFDITGLLKAGSNLLAVRVDNSRQETIPPDGSKRDFTLFGGLYRDVDLVFTDSPYMSFPWEAKKPGETVKTEVTLDDVKRFFQVTTK